MRQSIQIVPVVALVLVASLALIACGPDDPDLDEECFNRENIWQTVEDHTDDETLRNELAASDTAPAYCPAEELDTLYHDWIFANDEVDSGPEYDEVTDECCYMTFNYIM